MTNRAMTDAGNMTWDTFRADLPKLAEVGREVVEVPGSSGTRGDFLFPTGPAGFGRVARDGEEREALIFA